MALEVLEVHTLTNPSGLPMRVSRWNSLSPGTQIFVPVIIEHAPALLAVTCLADYPATIIERVVMVPAENLPEQRPKDLSPGAAVEFSQAALSNDDEPLSEKEIAAEALAAEEDGIDVGGVLARRAIAMFVGRYTLSVQSSEGIHTDYYFNHVPDVLVVEHTSN